MKKWLEYLENPYNVIKLFAIGFLTVSVLYFHQRIELVLFLILGFLWPYFSESQKLKESIERKKYRFSFIRFYLSSHVLANVVSTHFPIILKLLFKAFVPFLLFFLLAYATGSSAQLWPIFLGALMGELYLFMMRKKAKPRAN
jgi:uncharacterized membrane protein